MPNFSATVSTAPEVGILLATPRILDLRKSYEFVAKTAKESDGVTKKFFPKIMLRSASPSQAAPKSYSDLFYENIPSFFTKFSAHFKFGSG